MAIPKRLVVLIDTNVLLVSISTRSKYHWIYRAILDAKFDIAVNQEILSEYEELIGKHWNAEVASNVLRSIIELPNVCYTTVYYNLHLISSDPDDNKFVDCAFAANADYIVTHDSHFNVLEKVPFPKIPTITVPGFKAILESKGIL